jgi:hypothetical protein
LATINRPRKTEVIQKEGQRMSVPYDQMQDMPSPEQGITIEELPEGDTEMGAEANKLIGYLDEGNIVDKLQDPKKACTDTIDLYNEAVKSMEPWLKKYKRALNLAKLQAMSGDVEITEKSFPFEGASMAMMPYILEAMLDFSSRAASELVWTDNIIHAKIYGKNTPEKEDRAKRVADYSNYQLSEMIPNWRDNQDKGLLILASPGTFYKETFYDTDIQEVCSELCLADEVVFDHGYKSFDIAPDKFKKCKYTRNEVISFIRGEQEWDIDEDDLEEDKNDFEFIKAYTRFDLDEDGLKEPYIALIWEDKQKIVSLTPNYDEDTITEAEDGTIIKVDDVGQFTQYRFLPDPEGGPMGLGWGILLGPMFDAINTNVRQLIDAGTVHITAANSGLISQSLASGRGNAIQSGPIEVQLGQLTPVPNHGSGNLRDNIVQFPFAGPNPTVFQLMDYLVTSSRSMTNAAVNVQAQAGEAASLYLAKLQQGLKVPNSIIMRVYSCARNEFKKIAALNYKHFDNEKYNRILDSDEQASMEADFDPKDCDIRMASDPSQGSDVERVQRAQAIFDMAVSQPQQVLNYREAQIDVLKAMKTPNIEELAPEPDPNQRDPMQDLMMAQQAAEMEMRKEDQDLRREETMLKRQKLAMEAAREMGNLGLKADKQEAEITDLYTKSLERIWKAGIAAGQEAIDMVENIEDTFIEGDDLGRQTQTIDSSAVGNMAGQPGNENIPTVP